MRDSAGRAAVLLTLAGLWLWVAPAAPARADAGADYATFCASCHGSERAVLRKLRRWPAGERRARLAHFLEGHYCGGDRELAAGLAGYLDGLARRR